MDLNILIELSKLTSQIDENSVMIEQKLIHNNNTDIKNTSNQILIQFNLVTQG